MRSPRQYALEEEAEFKHNHCSLLVLSTIDSTWLQTVKEDVKNSSLFTEKQKLWESRELPQDLTFIDGTLFYKPKPALDKQSNLIPTIIKNLMALLMKGSPRHYRIKQFSSGRECNRILRTSSANVIFAIETKYKPCFQQHCYIVNFVKEILFHVFYACFCFVLSKLLLYFSFIYILDFLIKLWFHCILVSFL